MRLVLKILWMNAFSYYFFGNTLFGLINAIGATGYISEDELLIHLQQNLLQLWRAISRYAHYYRVLLFNDSLPYKGNLLTRLHELDELIAPLEHQSVVCAATKSLYVEQKDVSYA